jgi:hypothetical protein
VDIIRDTISFENIIAKECSQLVQEGEIIVPERSADMDNVLSVSAYLHLEPYGIADNRLSYRGRLSIDVLYLSKDSDKALGTMSTEVNVNDFMTIDGIKEGMDAQLSCKIANIEYHTINDRKLGYRITGDISAVVTSTEAIQCITDIIGDECMQQKSQVQYTRNICSVCENIKLEEHTTIPTSRSAISEAIALEPRIINLEARCVDTGVAVSGDAALTLIYLSEDSKLPEIYDFELPFSGMLEAAGATQAAEADCDAYVESCYYDVIANDNGENRLLGVELNIRLCARVRQNESLELVEDAYSLGRELEIANTELNLSKEISHTKGQYPIKEPVSLEENAPGILQLLRAVGTPYIDSVELSDNRADIEGVIEVDILYVTGDDTTPMYCSHSTVPFSQAIEARGAKEGMTAEVKADISHIGVNMLSDREAEIRLALNTDTLVTELLCHNAINDITEGEPNPDRLNDIASITIYRVKKGDTLWKLAKRFNTTVDEIVKLNSIENPDLIYPNERFIILKRVV